MSSQYTITPLPLLSVIHGYTIESVDEHGECWFLYTAGSPAGAKVYIREFFPPDQAVRDKATAAVVFTPVATLPAIRSIKKWYNIQFPEVESHEVLENGTSYIIYDQKPAMPKLTDNNALKVAHGIDRKLAVPVAKVPVAPSSFPKPWRIAALVCLAAAGACWLFNIASDKGGKEIKPTPQQPKHDAGAVSSSQRSSREKKDFHEHIEVFHMPIE